MRVGYIYKTSYYTGNIYVNVSHLKYTFNRVSKDEYLLNFSPACYFTFWLGQKALK